MARALARAGVVEDPEDPLGEDSVGGGEEGEDGLIETETEGEIETEIGTGIETGMTIAGTEGGLSVDITTCGAPVIGAMLVTFYIRVSTARPSD